MPDDSVVADLEAAHEWLLTQPTNGKTGIIGTCSGGRHALLTACRSSGWDGVADLWGGGVIMSQEELSPARPVAPIDYLPELAAPLLGLFGNDDRYPTPEQVDQLEAELKRLGKEYEFHRYDGASHGFFYYFAGRVPARGGNGRLGEDLRVLWRAPGRLTDSRPCAAWHGA